MTEASPGEFDHVDVDPVRRARNPVEFPANNTYTITILIDPVDWPIGVPDPAWNGYAFTAAKQRQRMVLRSGVARYRIRDATAADVFSVNFVFTQEQMNLFRPWYAENYDTKINIRLENGAGVVVRSARWTDPINMTLSPEHDGWFVDGQLESPQLIPTP